jgi:serine/threonine-protein kinase
MTHHHTAHILPGSVIANRYMVEGVLGSGAFGTVYEVFDTKTSTELALKVLNKNMLAHRYAGDMMLREGKILQRLEHPNVLKCYEVWEENGVVYIATELLQGDTLATHLEENTQLDPVFVLTVAEQLADALAHLHERGVTHRDIKPENIFIEHRLGRAWPVIMDFGLAFVEGSKTMGRLEQGSNCISGTPLYMSPEQITNRQISTPSDVYALGSVLYEMLTGHAPFEEPGVSAIETMKRQIVEAPRALFLDWDEGAMNTLVEWMLAKDPSERIAAAAVAEVLRAHEFHPASSAPHGWHTTRPTPSGKVNAIGKLAFRAS